MYGRFDMVCKEAGGFRVYTADDEAGLNMKELKEYLDCQADAFPGKVAYLYADIEKCAGSAGTDNAEPPAEKLTEKMLQDSILLERGCRDRVVSASTVKVPVMMALMQKLREEKRSITDRLLVRREQILDDSKVFEYGEREASFEELITWMIVNSDNTSTNVLLDYLGFDEYNQRFADKGLTETIVQRRMLDFEAVAKGLNNYISPYDFYHCMAMLYAKKESDRDASLAYDILKGNRDYDSLCRYLYERISVAHKTGGLDDIIHDAGVFETGNGDYFFGVFVSEFEPKPEMEKEAEKLIGRMSRAVFDKRQQAE